MKVYNTTEAHKHFSGFLTPPKPKKGSRSLFDVPSFKAKATTTDILQAVANSRAMRNRYSVGFL